MNISDTFIYSKIIESGGIDFVIKPFEGDEFVLLTCGLNRHLDRLRTDWLLEARPLCRGYPKGHGLEDTLNELFCG